MTKTRRIATVKATGDRYLVQQLSTPKGGEEARVHCWGEVIGSRSSPARSREEALDKPADTTHQGTKQFLAGAVEIVEIVVTTRLAHELLRQAQRNLKNVVGVRQSFRR